MEKANLVKIQNVESENISNISDNQLGISNHSYYIESINNNIDALHKFYQKNIKTQEKSIQNKINLYFSQINSIINILSQEKDDILLQYESALKKSEQKIRFLYSELFNLKVKNTFLENNIDILLKKEKELRLVKEKTGVVVENGAIIYNDRKENEIFILRKENSTLKNVIIKNEKEINEIKDKYKNNKENYEKQIRHLNNKLNAIKYKYKQSNVKTKGKSTSNINLNIDRNTPNLKLNYTLNNNSLIKGNNNCMNNGTNKINTHDFNNNNNSNSTNKNLIKKLEIQNEKKNKKNFIILDRKNVSLKHYQSSGHLNLKNKIINKLKKINKNECSRINQNGLNLSNLNKTNKSAIHNKKKLCLTPRNKINHDDNINNIKSYQTFQKIIDFKNNNKIKIKNCYVLKSSSSNPNINNNSINEIFINKSKNNIKNIIYRQHKLKNELTWSQNQLINNSVMPNSPIRMKKRNINKNNNMKNNNNLKSMNITNSSKISGYAGIKNKRERNVRANDIDKNNSLMSKFSLTSIRKKNTSNTDILNQDNNSPNSNNLK